MAVKKKPRRIAAASKGKKSVGPAKKAAGRKKAAASVKTRKPAAKAAKRKREPWGEFDDHGFRVGSDSSVIAACLIDGGSGREAITDIIAETMQTTETRGGNDKNISSLVSGILKRLIDTGQYEIEESWRLVPLNGASNKTATKKVSSGKGKKVKRKVRH